MGKLSYSDIDLVQGSLESTGQGYLSIYCFSYALCLLFPQVEHCWSGGGCVRDLGECFGVQVSGEFIARP